MAAAYYVGYRHHNGEVEGFVGYGLSDKGAEAHAHRLIREKIDAINDLGVVGPVRFDPARIITSEAGLTVGENATIRNDWKLGR